jgi:hypothetical protein
MLSNSIIAIQPCAHQSITRLQSFLVTTNHTLNGIFPFVNPAKPQNQIDDLYLQQDR